MQNIHVSFNYAYNSFIYLLFRIFVTMNTRKAFLLLNGSPPSKLPDLTNYATVCATDGAYTFLEENNIVPDFISGDFDSLKVMPKGIEIIHTPNQDYTDFDKILKVLLDKGFKNIDIYGASGKEQDHFLGNLHTAIQWKEKLELTFFDDYSCYFLADSVLKISDCKNQIISLLPFPKASGITTKGLQYPLLKESLSFGERIGTRNKAIENEVEISFEAGNLFIFINH